MKAESPKTEPIPVGPQPHGAGTLSIDANTSAGIDFLRGLFAILVLVAHSWEQSLRSFGPPPGQTTPWMNWVTSSIGHGFYWVIGFFVISGFCIQRSIIKGRATGHFSWLSFGLARVSRIYPTFVLGLLLAFVAWLFDPRFRTNGDSALPGASLGYTFLTSMLMLQAFVGTLPSFEQSWSLTYEAIYYAVWPFVLTKARYMGKRATWLAVLMVFASVTFCLGLMKGWVHSDLHGWLFYGWLVPVSGLPWIGGAWLAIVWSDLAGNHRLTAFALRGVVFYLLLSYGIDSWLNYSDPRMWPHVLSMLFAGPMFIGLIISLRALPFGRAPIRSISRWLGWSSYPLYLLHRPIQDLALRLVEQLSWKPGLFSGFLYFLVPAFTFSVLIGLPVEVTVLRWRKGWFVRRASSAVFQT